MNQAQVEKKSSRIVIPPALKPLWAGLMRDKAMQQQTAIVRLIEFVLAQDDVVQSMILGHIKPSDDLIELVLRRMKGQLKYRSSIKPPRT